MISYMAHTGTGEVKRSECDDPNVTKRLPFQYETWGEAHTELLGKLRADVDTAKADLKEVERILSEAEAMKKPDGW